MIFIVTNKNLATVPITDKMPWQQQKDAFILLHSTKVQPDGGKVEASRAWSSWQHGITAGRRGQRMFLLSQLSFCQVQGPSSSNGAACFYFGPSYSSELHQDKPSQVETAAYLPDGFRLFQVDNHY